MWSMFVERECRVDPCEVENVENVERVFSERILRDSDRALDALTSASRACIWGISSADLRTIFVQIDMMNFLVQTL